MAKRDPSAPPMWKLDVFQPEADVPKAMAGGGKHPRIGDFGIVLCDKSVLVCKGREGVVHLWSGGPLAFPRMPETQVDLATGVGALKDARKAIDRTTLDFRTVMFKGKWQAWLTCETSLTGHHLPIIVLKRRLAAYVEMTVTSGERGWSFSLYRFDRWFTVAETVSSDKFYNSLRDAILSGIQRAIGLVASACAMRDTKRRSAFDPAYAEQHSFDVVVPSEKGIDRAEAAIVKSPPTPKAPRPPKAKAEPRPPEIPAPYANLVLWNESRYMVQTARGALPVPADYAPKGKKPSQKALRDIVTRMWSEHGQPTGAALPEVFKPKPPPRKPKAETPAGAPAKKKPRKPKNAAPASSPEAPPASEAVDPEKDKAILGGIENILKQYMGGQT